MKEMDRRTRKTQLCIREALFNLMSEKAYSKITIQDIIDRANVGRSTFYFHYETKDDLLRECVEDILQGYFENYGDSIIEQKRIIPIAELLEHIRENSRVMKGILHSESGEFFLQQVQEFWGNKVLNYIEDNQNPNKVGEVPKDVVAMHVASTMIWMLRWWFDGKTKYTAWELDGYFQKLIKSSLEMYIDVE